MPVADMEEVVKTAKETIQERIPEAITERFEQAIDAAEQKFMAAVKEARRSAEDVRDNTRHVIKRYPFESVGIALGAGIILGVLGGWAVSRKLKIR